jgi:MFS family permease
MTDAAAASIPWFRTVDREAWRALLAANLGWLFDGFETYALILTAGPAMRSLVDSSAFPQIPAYVGTVFAITLFGWGVGGLIGGVVADYIGRKQTMWDLLIWSRHRAICAVWHSRGGQSDV